ncbi:FAD-dependent oxidoreductase [Atopobium fossor]|uniref:FAD-dependent oxidoreductase n=1 Tax=Atopobium fossor TaxID=39487 RepID=UPI0003F5419C|nr:FAD-dependent oxidoreductase [Atopobium fossor]
MSQKPNPNTMYDAVIVGGGVAGLTAAIYLARARYRVLVIEKDEFGGQINITEEVVNYPGIARTSGRALTKTMREQAEAFGAELKLAEATSFNVEGDIKTVHTTAGDFSCFGILLALGSKPRELGFNGESQFKGHGVAYCATCDGEFFTGKDVFVIGGGFAAAEESVFLTKYAKHVHILMITDDFTCAEASTEAARTNDKITIHTNTEVVELTGDSMPRTLIYRNMKTDELTCYQAPEGDTFGVFVLAGYTPATGLIKDIVELDSRGNIITNKQCQTSAPGVFAAGDVCVKDLRQVATAVGEAASAATQMEHHLAAMQNKTGIVPQRPEQNPSQSQALPIEKPGEAASFTTTANTANSELFSADMVAQLNAVFARMEKPIVLKLDLDDRPISTELDAYCSELASLSDKISVMRTGTQSTADATANTPCVHICTADGTESGLAFHGVPGGHEFTPFILGIYNVSGPGQPLPDTTRLAIKALTVPTTIQVLTSLTCTMCPDTVSAAQRIASLNPNVTAHIYDAGHFPKLKDRYNVMSVPCIIINNGEKVEFGRKTIDEMLALI